MVSHGSEKKQRGDGGWGREMQHHCAKSMPLSQSLAKHIGGKFSCSVFAGWNISSADYCTVVWLRQEVCFLQVI